LNKIKKVQNIVRGIFMPSEENLIIKNYNRDMAVDYAHRWVMGRNPCYYNFNDIGGDCTNFASQVIFNGCGVMNYTPTFGWYYINSYNRSPSWAGVQFLYDFLTKNEGIGPFAQQVDMRDILPGDIVQLSFKPGQFEHSPIVVDVGNPASIENILVATHSFDADYRPLNTYNWLDIRFLHIVGIRYHNPMSMSNNVIA
jgi:hypothetical protein